VTLEPGDPRHWVTGEALSPAVFRERHPCVHAVAGIGHPEQFFRGLREQGLDVIEHPRPDHHVYRPGELDFGDDRPVVMTAKDAVKCRTGNRDRFWVWPAELRLPDTLLDSIVHRLKR
jgi:tetraacyldisaccharide 4'-kinase